MNYLDIYTKTTNPLDDESVMDKILDAYASDDAFYTALVNCNSQDKKLYYSRQDSDDLYASLFNTWKKELLSIPKDIMDQAIANGLYSKDIYKVMDILRKTPDVSTKKEAEAVLNKRYEDQELEEAMEKYRWDSIGEGTGWTHISSRYIRAKKNIVPTIEHRFYINAEPTDLHELSKLFLDKCTAKKLPYYFKISEYDARDDNMVIYSNTKLLPQFLSVLEEIERERPDIISRCGQPPVLTGKIHNWIGYGSEPLEEHSSFNSKRSNIISSVIETEMKEWYNQRKNGQFKYQGKLMSMYEYFGKKLVEKELAKARRQLQRNPNAKYVEYSQAEIDNPAFVATLEREMVAKITSMINAHLNGEKPQTQKLMINGKERHIYSSDVADILKAGVRMIKLNDPSFVQRVKEGIKKESAKKGIDVSKYCFDIENAKLLLNEAKAEIKKTQTEHKKTPEQPKKVPEPAKTPEQPNKTRYPQQESTPKNSTEFKSSNGVYVYRPMTDEEILDSQRKLAEVPLVQPRAQYRKTTPPVYAYKPMTAEEILESQRKLAEVPMVKPKVKK